MLTDSAPSGQLSTTLAERMHLAQPGIAGRLLYWLVPIRRRTILDNLRHVFGDLTDRERRQLAQAHYEHLWRCIREIIRWLVVPGGVAYRVEVAESAWEFDVRRAGALLLMAHLGNFELVPIAGIRDNPEYRGIFNVIRRPLPFGWLDRFVRRIFAAGGIGVISDRGALRVVEDTLQKGGSVAFLLDQHASPRYGVVVDFLGQPASTFRSLAELSLRLQRPVLPYLTWREPDGTHVIRFDEPIFAVQHADFETAVRATTQAYSDVLGRFILAHPEQWFWVHRRWKASLPSQRRGAERRLARQTSPARRDGSDSSPAAPVQAGDESRPAPPKTATESGSDPTKEI